MQGRPTPRLAPSGTLKHEELSMVTEEVFVALGEDDSFGDVPVALAELLSPGTPTAGISRTLFGSLVFANVFIPIEICIFV
jgi:hypothetical protein